MYIAAIPALPYDFEHDRSILKLLGQLEEREWAYVDGVLRQCSREGDSDIIQVFGRSRQRLSNRWKYHQVGRFPDRTTESIARPKRFSRQHRKQLYRWGRGTLQLEEDGEPWDIQDERGHYWADVRSQCLAMNIECLLESEWARENPMLAESLAERGRRQYQGPYLSFTMRDE